MDKTTALISIINKIAEYQHPGKKMLQKLIYLIQRKGFDIGFDYGIHYYGPYCSGLDFAIHSLEMQGAIEIIQDGMTQRVHTSDISETIIRENKAEKLSSQQIETINNVVEKFAELTAWQLEVITTTDYVANELRNSGKGYDNESVLVGVKTIKGDKFSNDQIKWALSLLDDMGF
jgi:uncharacterized protein YwgA